MNADRLRALVLTWPHVVETLQWGDKLVLWTGDKSIGGRMFAVIALDAGSGEPGKQVVSFSAGAAAYPDLIELEGLAPAPYMARIYWVAAERWDVFSAAEWEQYLRRAYEITVAKLSPRTRATLTLPPAEQARLIAERQRILEAQGATKRRRAPALSRAARPRSS